MFFIKFLFVLGINFASLFSRKCSLQWFYEQNDKDNNNNNNKVNGFFFNKELERVFDLFIRGIVRKPLPQRGILIIEVIFDILFSAGELKNFFFIL